MRRVALGLHVHLPLPAKAVEVVHQLAAHEGLHGLVDVGDIDALLHRPWRDRHSRRAAERRQIGGDHAREFRPLAGCRHELVDVLGQELRCRSRAVFQDEGDAARRADAGNRGRRKRERDAVLDLRQSRRADCCWMPSYCSSGCLAFIPRLERDEEERAVGSSARRSAG